MAKKSHPEDKEYYRICIIGGGFSGLCAALQIKRCFGEMVRFTIIEKNEDFGGVWWSNRYPGCASDVVSHLYSLSFEPNPDWTNSYAPQPEILAYMQKVAFKNGLYNHALLTHTVEKVEWDGESNKWNVTARNRGGDRKEMAFNFVINGQGRFSIPKIPPEFSGFRGQVLHTGMWDQKISLHGKRVAVIGVGSTGAQLIPAIAPHPDNLCIYMRNPPYIVPAQPVKYSSIWRWSCRYIPFFRWAYRIYIFLQTEQYYKFFKLLSKDNIGAKGFCNFFMTQQIKDEKLKEKLVPSYEFGCKRIIPSTDFYQTLNRENVEVISSKIVGVEGKSIMTEDGDDREFDVLILATGFQVQDTYGSFNLFGENGIDVFKKWRDDKPSAFVGIMTHDAPNYFILLGPNTAPGYTTALFSLECQVNWVIRVIKDVISSGGKRVSVSPSSESGYMTQIHSMMQEKIYVHPSCASSWFRNSRGDVSEMYPGTTYSYWKKTLWPNRKDVSIH